VFVMADPMTPYRARPAPYKRRQPGGQLSEEGEAACKIILLDGNQDIVSKKELFLTAGRNTTATARTTADRLPSNNLRLRSMRRR